jgi:hypothetical protein
MGSTVRIIDDPDLKKKTKALRDLAVGLIAYCKESLNKEIELPPD